MRETRHKENQMKGELLNGGEFLLADAATMDIFTPEDFTDEQKQIAETIEDFMKKEIYPHRDNLEENLDAAFSLLVEKLRQCGRLGLFLAEVPEEHGGLELAKTTAMLMIERVSPVSSFSTAFCGHTGIGILPLVYYGTPDQKERYLGKLASGEWLGAYALTEPESGSDPLSCRTTATLSGDGCRYLLNGVKQFITNARFADFFTVFAKIDGRHFSAFLVEKGYEGFSVGDEEKKMGLTGSSTAPLFLNNVPVPAENLLGEPGRGHKIAFNVLNVGRLKVAAQTLGMAKGAFGEAAAYAATRKQFGSPIGRFGAIKEKLADLQTAVFASESVIYRVAGMLDARTSLLDRAEDDYYERYRSAIEEYAAECSIAKVFCTEQLDNVVDEAVQIHGGYGYISGSAVERYYRDSRIQRIFEGTNEINRLLIPRMLFRKADAQKNDLWELVRRAGEGIPTATAARGVFADECAVLARLKQLYLTLLGYVLPVREQQEVMLAIADMIITIFALESALLRRDKALDSSSAATGELLRDLVKTLTFDLTGAFQRAAARCSAYALTAEAQIALQHTIFDLSAYHPDGLLASRQRLAEAAVESGAYLCTHRH